MLLLITQFDFQGLSDTAGNLLLNIKEICHLTIELLRPQVAAVADINELGGDPQPIVCFPDTALENRFNIQIFADITNIFRLALVSERGGARGDSDAFYPGQVVDNLLSNAVTEIFLIFLGTQIFKCQHGYGRLGFSHDRSSIRQMEGKDQKPAKR